MAVYNGVNSTNKENTRQMTIGVWLSLFICCAYCTSILMFNIGDIMIPHFLYLFWVLSLVFLNKNKVSRLFSRLTFRPFYIFLVYYFIASLFVYSPITCINRVIVMFELISPIVMYELYSEYDNKARGLIILTISVIAAVNINILMHSVSIEVGLKQHEGEEGYLNSAYHWIYSFSIIEGFIVYAIRRVLTESIRYKVIFLVFLVAAFIALLMTVVISLYATALVLLLISVLMGLLYGRKYWLRKFLAILFGVLVFFIYCLPIVISLLEIISPDTAMYVNRAYEVYEITQGNVDAEGSGGARMARSVLSLKTFFIHPIMGLTPHTPDVVALDMPAIPGTKIGNHAEWVDDLGLYGVFALLLFSFLWKYTKLVYSKCDITFVFLAFIILGFLNKCFYIVNMTLIFLYAPLFMDFIMSFRKRIQ